MAQRRDRAAPLTTVLLEPETPATGLGEAREPETQQRRGACRADRQVQNRMGDGRQKSDRNSRSRDFRSPRGLPGPLPAVPVGPSAVSSLPRCGSGRHQSGHPGPACPGLAVLASPTGLPPGWSMDAHLSVPPRPLPTHTSPKAGEDARFKVWVVPSKVSQVS